MGELTSFQTETVQAVMAMLTARGRQADREVRQGVVPFYSQQPVTSVRLQSGELEIWIFEEDATFRSGGRGGTYERPDFESEEALRKALVADLEEVIE